MTHRVICTNVMIFTYIQKYTFIFKVMAAQIAQFTCENNNEIREAGTCVQKKGVRLSKDSRTPRSTAATYSPNWCVSTIGARGLNCSVRYGKRWDPAAKATANIT